MNWKRKVTLCGVFLVLTALVLGVHTGWTAPVLNPAVDLSKPNFAYSPPLRKFINDLPGVGSPNNLTQQIPLATANTATFPGSDYYEIALVEYNERMHGDLPVAGTKMRGYVQEVNGVAVGTPHYLGPLILATRNRPVRIKFTNRLATGAGGNLFLPVDTTIMGAGMGPKFANGTDCNPDTQVCANYTQNRATLHLHGGLPPWISDGTAHQWMTPAGETTPYVKGASQHNVPDMWYDTTTKNVVGACAGQLTCAVGGATTTPSGVATFYWPNQQSGRLMFYHDHALGITRLNVYGGEAAGYLLADPAEETPLAAAGVPGTIVTDPATGAIVSQDLAHLIALVIQDKTFVYDNSITTSPPGLKDATRFTAATDPLWDAVNWGAGGNLWYPHVYVPNQDPTIISGANPLGRWDYGPWFWPVFPATSPYPPTVSHIPEAFMDTPLVNGTAYPFMSVQPTKYRLRILNANNDRMLNLQLYQADSGYATAATATATVAGGIITGIVLNTPGAGYNPNSAPMVHIVGGGGYGAWATATVAPGGSITAVTLTNGGAGYTSAPTITIGGNTEVKMVPAVPNAAIPFPPLWLSQTPGMTPDILDSRLSGVPDPTLRGPAMIQIGTEGGLLPAPVVLPNTPVGFEQNKRNIVVLNVLEKTLFMAPAERADVVVDFTNFAGKTIILYNDSPAPVPAGDPRYDFYTGNPDYSATGGANYQGGAASTQPGYGPNTRTIMQFRVTGVDSGVPGPVDDAPAALVTALNTNLPAIFKTTQDPPVVPQPTYPAASGGNSATATYSTIQANYLTYVPPGGSVSVTNHMLAKTIQELFDPEGRMNATLGVELPFTNSGNQTTVPLGFIDPTTETLAPGETQIWKITHNGVDTHGIHFHLVNVQVINRVGWDGAIRETDPNELGWKDTVRMNPLEDIIVAMRAKVPTYPFAVPESIRPLNPAKLVGSSFASFDPLTGKPITVTNTVTNFGYEYTWHCHILGHEENDMMRPLVLNPQATADMLWRNTSSGETDFWYMDGTTLSTTASLGVIPTAWQLASRADFNSDGQPDIFWRNTATGDTVIWYMNGTVTTGMASFGVVPTVWAVAAVADFNGDGKPDVLWRNTGNGDTNIWYVSNGAIIGTASLGIVPLSWTVAAAADFNGDGKSDLLLRNQAGNGDTVIWYVSGAGIAGSSSLGIVPTAWTIAAAADFNSDGKPDILWRNTATGDTNIWYLSGGAMVGGASLGNMPLAWTVVTTSDFNNDVSRDILWRNTGNGDTTIWYLNGGAVMAATGSLGNIPTVWTLATQ
jgi:FtsP/CotA-like multicopper oxidase with cupredoxin domain